MTLTTGALLRRIIETPLSASAHKLATLILDGIAWKDGYNGLDHGTAAFTLSHLAEKMGVSRQHLSDLLSELAASNLALTRWKPNGKYAPWNFRFGGPNEDLIAPDVASAAGDTSLYRESKNKTIFTGRIEIGDGTNVYRTPWADVIKAAKAALPCWNVDTQAIWDRFVAFNKARGNAAVPAGFLLGFMRKWRKAPCTQAPQPRSVEKPLSSGEEQALVLARPAPFQNRQFHQRDLERLIGSHAYEVRVRALQALLKVNRFAACLAVHGKSVAAGEISV
ncbi:hypothetical protein [Cypionkella psychrotolerans]|uniref:hypothetical protein n=1 Tax=Cypionkella psychrotolerans TaxID=1678131 RepID=UPI0006B526BC|nr:hypothetical protein [Cypionkella psychrotolerans]